MNKVNELISKSIKSHFWKCFQDNFKFIEVHEKEQQQQKNKTKTNYPIRIQPKMRT